MITNEKLQSALREAELWAEHGYTEKSRSYWSGMRDTLRVILGITTERPTVTSPDTDVAASVLLAGYI